MKCGGIPIHFSLLIQSMLRALLVSTRTLGMVTRTMASEITKTPGYGYEVCFLIINDS